MGCAAVVLIFLLPVLDDLPPELHGARNCIRRLDLSGADEAYQAARNALKDRDRDREVRAGLKAVKKQMAALREFTRAKKYANREMYPEAFRSASRVLRGYGELWFVQDAEVLYASVKSQVCHVVNDFETRASRRSGRIGSTSHWVGAEVVEDLRVSSDGRHALKVRFDARRPGVKKTSARAIRAVVLRSPGDLGEKMDGARALTFSLFSYRAVYDRITVSVVDAYGAQADHPGIALNFTGRKTITLKLNRFQTEGGFQWGDARKIQFSSRDPGEMDFALDDVQILR